MENARLVTSGELKRKLGIWDCYYCTWARCKSIGLRAVTRQAHEGGFGFVKCLIVRQSAGAG